jgi:kinesin family protein 15
VFRKFEESQETIKEADLMLNTLLKANENARYDTEQWKNAGQELATERGSLIDEIQRTKNAFEEKEEQFVSMQELMQMNLQETRDLISSVKEVAINSMRGLEEEFEAINTEIGSLKLDLSHALNAPNSWLEEILSIVAEKDSAAFVLHSCQVEALLGKLQTLYTEIDSLNVKLHESNRSISQLEENNMILRGEVDRSCSLGTKLEVEIKTSLGKINEKERQLERLLGQLDQLEKNMSDLEGQEDLMMKWLAAKDFELANLISGVEEKHNNDLEVASKLEIIQSEKGELHLQLNKSCEKIEQMQREKEELCFQLEQSCNKITLMEDQQESICKEIDLLRLQHHESNTRAGELEKYNMDLKNEIKEYKVAIAELQLDLNDGDSERDFEVVKGRDSLGGQLETLKMEMSDLKMKKETLNKAMIEKVSEVAILHQELDQHARVQSSLQETLRQVDGLQRENHELSLQLKQSSERIIHLEEEKMALGQEESRLQERLSSLLLELDQSCERSAYFEKLSADANEKLINGHEEIGALHRQLEEASSSAMCLEEKSKELQDKLSTLEGSFGALQSDLDMKDRDLIQVQLAHSKILEEIEHNHQKSEDLMTRLSASEMENMKLRENIGKEVETEERLFSELQQSNDVIEEIRRENAKHAVDLQEREAEIIKLFQQKEDISNHLYGVQRENEAMKETLSSQNDKLQDLADQIALKDDYLKKVQTIALQLTEDSCYSTHVAEKLEAKLSSLQDRVFSVMPVERADEMLVIEKFLKYISELEDNAHMFLAKTELLELNFKDLFSQNVALMSELQWKEEILKGLQFDLSLLQDSASKAKDQKDEVQEASATLKLVQEDLLVKANELNTIMSHNIRLEIELMEKVSEVTSLNVELTKLKETLASISNENSQLAAGVEDLLAKRNSTEEELEEKQRVIEGLEEELLEMSSLVDHQMINSIESMKCELNNYKILFIMGRLQRQGKLMQKRKRRRLSFWNGQLKN